MHQLLYEINKYTKSEIKTNNYFSKDKIYNNLSTEPKLLLADCEPYIICSKYVEGSKNTLAPLNSIRLLCHL